VKGHSRGGWFCAGHMIVASSGFGHSAGLSGPPDSRLSQGGMTFGVLSSRSCRAVANTGKGWIFEQRLHPMPRQLPQPHQNPEYCRGSQDAIPADFPPAGRAGCWPSWVEFLGNRKRAMAQKVPTATTAIIGVGVEPRAVWAAEHGKARDPILKRWCSQLQYAVMVIVSKTSRVSLRGSILLRSLWIVGKIWGIFGRDTYYRIPVWARSPFQNR
jgi:hypothetical protein